MLDFIVIVVCKQIQVVYTCNWLPKLILYLHRHADGIRSVSLLTLMLALMYCLRFQEHKHIFLHARSYGFHCQYDVPSNFQKPQTFNGGQTVYI